MKILLRFALHVVVTSVGMSISGYAQESRVHGLTGHASTGGDAFKRNCAGCHAASGDGKGTFAPYLDPRPRDLTAAIYHCRSTPSGSLPTDDDLYDTMMRGIVTTAMPSWRPLPPQTRADMVAYIKKFSPRFASEGAGVPLTIPPETQITFDGIEQGAAVYQKLACASCHGAKGHGDGPNADTLTDIKHRPDAPYDFTITARFKCGATNQELYRTMITGMDGTPMKSYAQSATPDEMWQLVHFVRTLQAARKSEENRVLKAGRRKPADESMEIDPKSKPRTPAEFANSRIASGTE
jgi:mono/diheme cytochrome c family protein